MPKEKKEDDDEDGDNEEEQKGNGNDDEIDDQNGSGSGSSEDVEDDVDGSAAAMLAVGLRPKSSVLYQVQLLFGYLMKSQKVLFSVFLECEIVFFWEMLENGEILGKC